MGRLKKYNTEEEKREAVRLASKKYYWKNKSTIDKKARTKYQNKNGNSVSPQKNGYR